MSGFLLNPYSFGGVPIAFVGGKSLGMLGTTSSTAVSLTDLTGGLASAPAEGDIVIVSYGFGGVSDIAITISTGYTEVFELYANGSSYDNNYALAYKIMTASPDTTITVTGSQDSAEGAAVAIQVWRNVDSVTPMDIAATSAVSGTTLLVNPSAMTPETPGAVIVMGASTSHNLGVQTWTCTGLSRTYQATGNDTYDTTTVIASYEGWTSGPFDGAAWTWSGGTTSWPSSFVKLVLKPK